MRIRPLAAADVGPIAARLAALPLMARYGRSEAALAFDIRAGLSRGEGLLVADGPAGPVGLAWFLRGGTLALGGYLRLLAVGEGAQGGGAGAALLAAYESEVARVSRHAFLLVSDFNAGAQRFYERHGYRRVGALPEMVLPGVAELLYWKRLRSPGE